MLYNTFVSCRKCIACLKKRQTDWYLRCLHESYSHERAIVGTLTYDDEHLPVDGEYYYYEVQKFLKRLRKYVVTQSRKLGSKSGKSGIKFAMFPEYGKKKGRIHWHFILYGVDFVDRWIIPNGEKPKYTLYSSPTLESLWGNGFISFTDFRAEGASYACKYIMKSALENDKQSYIEANLVPLRQRQSQGLGKNFILKYAYEVMRDKGIRIGKFLYGIPRYYLAKLKEVDFNWYVDYVGELQDNFKMPDYDELRKRSLVLEAKYMRAS